MVGVMNGRLVQLPLVVFCVGPDFEDKNLLFKVADKDYQAVVVAADVENDSIVGKEISGAKTHLDVLRGSPGGLFDSSHPRLERGPGPGILVHELGELVPTSDPH